MSEVAAIAASPESRAAAEHLAARLPDLRTQALRIAATVALGSHGRRRAGPGDSFWQFRPYNTGDPVRSIDWRRSARGDRHFVRQREWEAAQSFWLWLDRSPSMDFTGDPSRPAKLDRAAILAIAMASLLLRSGERIGLMTGRGPLALGAGQKALDRLLQHWSNPDTDTGESLPPLANLPRYATVLAFGDTWAALNDWDRRLAALAGPGVRGQLLHVIDPSEQRFDLTGRVRLEGMEGEASELLRRAEDLAAAYAERFDGHCRGLTAICERRGWRYRRHATDEAPILPLLALYEAISLDRRAAHA